MRLYASIPSTQGAQGVMSILSGLCSSIVLGQSPFLTKLLKPPAPTVEALDFRRHVGRTLFLFLFYLSKLR
ncbi:hypothetical protein K445DRAFT_318480 [Daldinia sp. EC12]|nr:hypothetical protein K445DRAFT_318480 [Daldinia sp. EC12]